MNSIKNEKLYGIEALRGIAALVVAIGHNRGMFGQIELGSLMDRLTANAIFGVEIFFIISGFIISYSTRNINSPSLRNTASFLVKRIFRIYPVYFVILAVYVALFYRNIYTGVAEDGTLSTVNIIKSFFLIPLDWNSLPPYYGWGTIIVSWSLAYEMYFYIVFALSMSISIKYRALIASIVLVSISILLPVIFNGNITIDAQRYYFNGGYLLSHFGFIGNPIVFDFILGMIIAQVLPSINKFKINNGVINSLAIALLGFSFVFWLNGISEGHGLTKSAYIAFAIVSCVIILERNSVFVFNKVLISLGTISYSLYLIHVPVIKYIELYGQTIGLNTNIRSLPLYISSLTISVCLAYVIFNVIEKPFINAGARIAKKISG
ncbi:acyltransferase family protein [Enterobacter hormaechei]|uniref:acyltransferase family protein n=1 Tax=Enterobacter cloacae complex TaxID=354276 RepID=UPI000D20DEB7|nr:acyltransferase [Enterobacter hormaechei]AVJ78553.1 acyltransferase family protein [Enterobacter hormaechei subsp. hoffmannii]